MPKTIMKIMEVGYVHITKLVLHDNVAATNENDYIY